MCLLLTAQSAMAASISLSPTSNGYINQWTSSGAFANWVNVADAACDGLTDFNQTSAVGNIDAYKVDLSAIPNGSNITSIAVEGCYANQFSVGTNSTPQVFYRWNGSNSGFVSLPLPSSNSIFLTNRNTWSSLSFSKTTSSELEIGIKYRSGSKGLRVSQMRAIVDY